ncbi:MAG: lipocalin family protein [Actinobacteria bacterium]|nr:lipocalin family protein [Actinomycetota bacterium]
MKLLTRFSVIALIVVVSLAMVACGGAQDGEDKQVFPEPEPGCAYFTQGYDMLQTESAQQLSKYLASEHMEYDLDGWFFFGSLQDSASPQDPGVFFISMQRMDVSEDGGSVPLVPAIVAYGSTSLGQYVYGGEYAVDMQPLVNVLFDPWKVEVSSMDQEDPLLSMELTSGSMGEAGAEYRLAADVKDQLGGRLQAEVLLRDRLGVVNQGYGTASFFPQFLTQEQEEQITGSYSNSVRDYLEATGDPMACQGSFYYSLPLLDVEEFTITRDGTVLSTGTGGTMWMDNVVQTYDEQAVKVLIDGNASWDFFSIMLPEEDAALMVIRITSANGALNVASLFRAGGDTTQNGALEAACAWPLDMVEVEPLSGSIWTSPNTGLQYPQQHRIQLASDTTPMDLTITMVRENQEIVAGDTIKYEGLATVEGTLGGEAVTGTAFVELQPVGHL